MLFLLVCHVWLGSLAVANRFSGSSVPPKGRGTARASGGIIHGDPGDRSTWADNCESERACGVDRKQGKDPWWFTALPGQSNPSFGASVAVSVLVGVLSIMQWSTVSLHRWWPQAIPAAATSALALMFLATALRVHRNDKAN